MSVIVVNARTVCIVKGTIVLRNLDLCCDTDHVSESMMLIVFFLLCR